MRKIWLVAGGFLERAGLRLSAGLAATIGLGGMLVAGLPGDEAVAKTPGKTYCFRGVCHRVLTLAETRGRVGKRSTAVASYYDDCRVDRFNPCGLTSSGTVFRPHRADNAASPIYPNGTKLLVFNPRNGRAAVVRVDNAGPYKRGRTLDLSRGAAQKLGFRHTGVARLIVKVLAAPTPAEARYRARRQYAPVKGYIGRFSDVVDAAAAAGYGRATEVAEAKPPESKQVVASLADPSWAPAAARAAVTLPGQFAEAAVPPPRKPDPSFKRAIREMAVAARRRRLAMEREQREAARQVALAAAAKVKAAEEARQAAERRRRQEAAARKQQTAARQQAASTRAASAARPATSNQAGATRTAAAGAGGSGAAPVANAAAGGGAGQQGQGGAATSGQGAGTAAPAAPPSRPRTVWRREILDIAQNSS